MEEIREQLTSLNPATEAPIRTIDVASAQQITDAVASARAAQRAWGRAPVRERAAVVWRFLQRVVDRRDEIAASISTEVGKPRFEAMMHEVTGLALIGRYYAERAEQMLEPTPIPLGLARHRASYLHHKPRGVAAIIAPFNFPFVIAGGSVIANLLAGNAVVLKPSELTPGVGDLLRALLLDAGLDPSLFQVLHGDGRVGAALVNAQPDHVELTGSVAAGRSVGARCGELLIPCSLELGGKAAALVLPDADLDRAAEALTWGGFANCGQVCASVERVLVHDSVYDALLQRLLARVAKLRVGDPSSGEVDLGPMVSGRQREKVHGLVQRAVAAGARAHMGGEPMDRPGFFYAPTVLGEVTPAMDIANQEIFGPVLPLLRMTDDDAMILETNRVRLGLAAYVFSDSAARARAVAEQLRCGTVMVNDVLAAYSMPETPWAGLGDSGLGRSHGEAWLRELSEVRHVNVPNLPTLARDPWWFPYSARQARGLGQALRLLRPSRLRA